MDFLSKMPKIHDRGNSSVINGFTPVNGYSVGRSPDEQPLLICAGSAMNEAFRERGMRCSGGSW
ncbi:hypothetical protein FHU41_001663 [Psychromicrobium silvestre]|uniref:Uncharacterized protein n=1 Tax=Psychromicrobium silvestre TaxID=1645614 RepID=A0A7Y9LTQ2_9MICC|nr:hypothetical protein [Psychromicrobium silvestre]